MEVRIALQEDSMMLVFDVCDDVCVYYCSTITIAVDVLENELSGMLAADGRDVYLTSTSVCVYYCST